MRRSSAHSDPESQDTRTPCHDLLSGTADLLNAGTKDVVILRLEIVDGAEIKVVLWVLRQRNKRRKAITSDRACLPWTGSG